MTGAEPTKCLSSHLHDFLLHHVRNPDKDSYDYSFDTSGVLSLAKILPLAGRVVVTELALPLVVLIALVETAVYGLLDFVLSDCTSCFSGVLSSAGFTLIWSLYNTAMGNFLSVNLKTGESSARVELGLFKRDADHAWIKHQQNYIETHFLLDVMRSSSLDVRAACLGYEVTAFSFIIIKGLMQRFIEKNSSIPFFLNEKAKAEFNKILDSDALSDVLKLEKMPAIFELPPDGFEALDLITDKDPIAKVITMLKGVAHSHLQGNEQFTSTWNQALACL